ncbi:MAG: ribosome biogenesis GTP-binding protein YihA/YsxC [Rhodothalassiaceae bacterium]
MDEIDPPAAEAAFEEAGRRLFAGPCRFVKGVVALDGLPPADRPEIAFAGRSNVGKSSLVNAMTGRKTLARTSNTPGRTQEINYFDLGGQAWLVDLPGYGYARVAKSQVDRWTELMTAYLRGRAGLKRVFLLVDSRHGLKPNDREMMAMLDTAAVSYQLVLTKLDKLKGPQRDSIAQQVRAGTLKNPACHPELLATSAEKGWGIAAARATVAALIAGG